jgi:hypothetical protein
VVLAARTGSSCLAKWARRRAIQTRRAGIEAIRDAATTRWSAPMRGVQTTRAGIEAIRDACNDALVRTDD